MKGVSQKRIRTWSAIIAMTAWFALGLQLYILIDNTPGNGLTVPGAIIRFLSFFTILSNLFVALCLSFSLANSTSRAGRFFSRPSVQSATAVNILVVGIVYNLVLRNLWNPKGRDLVADELLHVVVPLLFVAYWFISVPKGILKWKDAIAWLVFPMSYLIYSLVRGALIGWYPYPFLNVPELGYIKVMTTILLMLAAFLGISILLIAINRSIKRS